MQQRWAAENQARAQAGEQHARANIDQFADEVGADGKPLRPHFNAVLPILLDLFKANPQRSLLKPTSRPAGLTLKSGSNYWPPNSIASSRGMTSRKPRIAQRGNTQGPHQPCGQAAGQ